MGAQTMNLEWVYGFSKDVIGGVLNLTDEHRKAYFYCAGNTGVVLDVATNEQILLQGHRNIITAAAVSMDKKFLVTVDYGENSMVIVWDSVTGLPIKTISTEEYGGAVAVDISSDASFIATLGGDDPPPQKICIWEWTTDREDPMFEAEMPQLISGDIQTCIKFNPDDETLLVTNGDARVVFWCWEEGSLKHFAPPISSKDFRQQIGNFTQTVFLPQSEFAVSATDRGDLLMWDQIVSSSQEVKKTDKKATKIVRVHESSAITFLVCLGHYLVTGGADGNIRFFDFQFRILAWFEDLDAGPITSISFDRDDEFTQGLVSKSDDEDFDAPNFIVGTSTALVIAVDSSTFEHPDLEASKGIKIAQGQEAPIQALSAHPSRPLLAVAGASGQLHLWDFYSKRLVRVTMFNNLRAHSMTFDPKGQFLAVGFRNGVLKILDPLTLETQQTFRHSKECITEIVFADSCNYFATSDAERCVSIYRWTNRDENPRKEQIEWVFVGRYRSHTKAITGLQFARPLRPDSDHPRLLSVGEDHLMVEYNLEQCSVVEGIQILNVTRLEQVARPTSLIVTDEGIWTANDLYKLRMFSLVPAPDGSHACYKTVLGPTFGGPINKMKVLEDETGKYLAYSTHSKVVGMVKFPLDGNPQRSMGLIAHSNEVTDIVVSHDGRYVFTAGGRDFAINQWTLNTEAFSRVADQETGVDPYIDLVEGGKDGEFFSEMNDYFYYAQIRRQGEVSTSPRRITRRIAVHQIPDMMRALSFYPSEHDISHMQSELEYEMGEEVKEIDFETFLKLYVNHRPVHGIERSDIEHALDSLGAVKGFIEVNKLFDHLKNIGETFTQEELDATLAMLIPEEEELEKRVSGQSFAEDLLRFEPYDEDSEEEEFS